MLDEFSTEELEFIEAIEDFKAEHSRAFLSWTEVLDVLKQLGYRRTEVEATLNRDAAAS